MTIIFISVAQASNSLTAECISTTPNLGNSDRAGATFMSNMDELIDKLQGKEIFMRTAGLFICYGPDNIYGVRVILEHDEEKDPDHTQILEDIIMYNDNFYEKIIGA